MADRDEHFAQAVSELTNALQVALALAERLAPDAQQHARDAADLRDAITRAAAAARDLRGERLE
ncbi:MAG: hypothetical protein A3H96_09470 [Acidobacteria bacterium RIFCSPLOWO2_02_FULL_67_36]|nr:MAG: hypothetical protein A3H96_09470 [Acidobacteria bacterium RIFCSPLOWO2_02_FULL_67_36]OFW24998.1 MAG: hypothetical protein A3G21_16270 [Acidobacteria bacterium RIFCSPLOWO2_12_FULL_66_21]